MTSFEFYTLEELNEAIRDTRAELADLEAQLDNLQPYWDTQAHDSIDAERAEIERDLRELKTEYRKRIA